jgi:hypothetical protein
MQAARNDGQVTLVVLKSMIGLSIGLKYFDNDKVVYVSPETHNSFLNKTLPFLDFVTLKYRSREKDIELIVEEIINELKKCPSGAVSSDGFNEMHQHHHEHQVSIDLEHSDGQGLPV